MLADLWNRLLARLDALWGKLAAGLRRLPGSSLRISSRRKSGPPEPGTKPKSARLRRTISRISAGLAGVVGPLFAGALLWQIASACIQRIPPGEVQVRVHRFGAGIVPRDFGPGWSLTWPFLEHWERFDTAPIWLRFGLGSDARLELRTRDDNPATLDVAVLYRIKPGEVQRLAALGLRAELSERVRATTADTLRSVYASLESEQWFLSDQRQLIANSALEPLRKNLSALSVEPLEVRISQVTFSKEFEQKLQEKRLSYQAQRRSEAQLAVERVKQELLEANAVNSRAAAEVKSQWDKRLASERAQAETERARLRIESNLADATRMAAAEVAYSAALAQGELALGQARALAHLDELEVLAAPGGEAFLAAEAAGQLNLEMLHFDPQESGAPLPLDLNAWQALLTPLKSPR